MSDKSPRVTEDWSSPPGTKTETVSAAYNLFGARDWSGQMCAVTLDRPTPGFITAEEWQFLRTLELNGSLPLGFDLSEASEGTRWRGFYLFTPTAEVLPQSGHFAPFRVPTAEQIRLHAHTVLARINLTNVGTGLG